MIQRTKFEIRKADVSFADSIADLEKQCFSKPWSEKSIKESMINGISYFYIAMIGNEVIGYIGFYIVCKEGYLYNVAVKEKYRGMGIGTALLKQAVDVSRETKTGFLSLEVRVSNKAAIGLYRKLGFKKAGIRKNFYSSPKEDALIMTLRSENTIC